MSGTILQPDETRLSEATRSSSFQKETGGGPSEASCSSPQLYSQTRVGGGAVGIHCSVEYFLSPSAEEGGKANTAMRAAAKWECALEEQLFLLNTNDRAAR